MALTAKQLEERLGYIGGSDAAAVLGLSRYKTPVALWAEKTGQVEPEDISGKMPVKLGHYLEEFIAKEFTAQTGKKVRRVNETLIHKQYPFIATNLDRRVVGENAILECKAVSAWKSKEFEGEEIPQEYIIQVVHEIAVSGADRGYLAALVGNTDLVIKTIERDEQMIQKLIAREVEFWTKFVQPRVMPRLITRYDDKNLLKLFPNPEPGSEVVLNANDAHLCEMLLAYKADLKNLEGMIAKAENELKAKLGDKESGSSAHYSVTWKPFVQNRVNAEVLRTKYPEVAKEVTAPISGRKFLVKEREEN